jgi:hypothetical protein
VADPRIKELAFDALAATLGAPVDVFARALRPFGYQAQPVLGSQFIRQRLPQQEIPAPQAEFARAARMPSPIDQVPQVDEMGRVIRPEPTPERQFSPLERFAGGAEVAESILRGAVGFPIALVGGAYQAAREGDFSPQNVENRMSPILERLGYMPKTEAGQEMMGDVGQFMERLETEYKVPAIGAAPSMTPLLGVRGVGAQLQTEPLPVGMSTRAVGEVPTGAPRSPIDMAREMTPRSPLGFYSAVEETVANIPQAKGTGDQFLAQIQKTAGVKPDEIKWTGLDEFLKGKKSVTKQEIQDYLAANRVDLQEVRLGELSPEQSLARDQAINRYREITDLTASTRQQVEEGLISSQEARAIFEPLYAERFRLDKTINDANKEINTKFSQYTTPGGENYREILLTLPSKETVPMREQFSMYDQSGELISQGMWPPSRRTQEVIAENPNFRIERTMVPDRSKAPQGTFVSSHFDEPNILAHMRVNDRVVDGKKTLFIEEIQSDWHQAGRKKGYQQKVDPQILKQAEDKVDAAQNAVNEKASDLFGRGERAQDHPERLALVEQLNLARAELNALKQTSAVPDAPFKTSWHELALKRAIQEASEKGYDRIAFTTGQTQAARYDLSKQVDNIRVESLPETPGVQFIDVYTPEGKTIFMKIENGVIREGQYSGKRLEEVVGKELAGKITAVQAGQKIKIEGDDLSIGGLGMKGFYDNILPKSLNNLGKKFDAKVGKSKLNPTISKDELAARVYGQGETYKNLPSESKRKIDQMYMGEGTEVWTMDITPKMRESVTTKGQPLFQVLPPAAAAAAVEEEEEVQ